MDRPQDSTGRQAQARGRKGPGRRLLLAAPFLPLAPARAQASDTSLSGIMRRGVLRVSISFWTASFLGPPGEPDPPMRDAFHEGMARLLAQELGVRAEIETTRRSGDGHRWVAAGEVDLALAPPITRGLLREVMFCTPHLALDLVVLAKALPLGERGRPNLQAARLGGLTVLAAELAERRTLEGVRPFATPWLLARGLLDGELDGVIVTRIMAEAMRRHVPQAEWRVQLSLSNNFIGGAVAYGAHDLRRVLNLVTDQLRADGRLAVLYTRETGLPFNPPDPA